MYRLLKHNLNLRKRDKALKKSDLFEMVGVVLATNTNFTKRLMVDNGRR